jgi:hypothetical protein
MKKEKVISWVEFVEKKDPTRRTRPVASYVFNDGKRTFYTPKRKK